MSIEKSPINTIAFWIFICSSVLTRKFHPYRITFIVSQYMSIVTPPIFSDVPGLMGSG